MGLYKQKLIFDPADLSDSDNVGAYTRAGTDGDLISSTLVSGKEGLDVNVINASLTVTATDFDIRDITHTQDSIKVGDGTDFLAISAAGEGNVVLSSTSGVFAEDSAHASGNNGMFMLAVRNDAAATVLTSADGDYSALAVDNKGRLFVNAEFTSTADFVYPEDSVAANGDQLAAVAAVRQDVLASSVSADGDYGTLKITSLGALWTAPVGNVDDDAADAGFPIKVGGKAYTGATALAAVSDGDRVNQAADLYRREWVNDSPSIALTHTKVTVGATAVALPTTAASGRRRILIQNIANNSVWLGGSAVTISGATQGLELAKGATIELPFGQAIPLFGIAAGAGNDVIVFELA